MIDGWHSKCFSRQCDDSESAREKEREAERDIKRDIKFDIPICIRCSICDPLTYFSMLPLIIHFISVLYLPNMHTHTDHSNAMLINFQNVWTILHFYMHTLKLMHHNWLYILTRDCVTSEKNGRTKIVSKPVQCPMASARKKFIIKSHHFFVLFKNSMSMKQ